MVASPEAFQPTSVVRLTAVLLAASSQAIAPLSVTAQRPCNDAESRVGRVGVEQVVDEAGSPFTFPKPVVQGATRYWERAKTSLTENGQRVDYRIILVRDARGTARFYVSAESSARCRIVRQLSNMDDSEETPRLVGTRHIYTRAEGRNRLGQRVFADSLFLLGEGALRPARHDDRAWSRALRFQSAVEVSAGEKAGFRLWEIPEKLRALGYTVLSGSIRSSTARPREPRALSEESGVIVIGFSGSCERSVNDMQTVLRREGEALLHTYFRCVYFQ
jgi:hypothetical protein